MAALRIALGEVATRDFVRSELRALLDEASVTRRSGRRGPEKGTDKAPDQTADSFGSTQEVELPTDSG